MNGRRLTEAEIKWLFSNLRKVNFFATVGLDSIDRIVSRFSAYDLPPGKMLIREGTEGDAFYIIKSGECEVFKKSGLFSKKRLAVLKEGDFAGEMSLVRDTTTTASIKTRTPCVILALLKSDFLKIKSENKQLSDEIDYIIEKREFDNAFAK